MDPPAVFVHRDSNPPVWDAKAISPFHSTFLPDERMVQEQPVNGKEDSETMEEGLRMDWVLKVVNIGSSLL